MKPLSIVGLLLILVGVFALVSQRINYTSRETVVDVGPIHATADRQKTLALPPVVGALALAGGIALVVVGMRKAA